jgi:CRISPR-associated exonuclease Cas4
MYYESEWVPLSALQHYMFCPRQCALNYIENIWVENYLTAAGRILHNKTEDLIRESRKSIVHEFGVELASNKYKIFGQADVIEFEYIDEKHTTLIATFPIEYKRGKQKNDYSDEVQLCAQGLCIEEMLDTNVEYGFLFYFNDRKKIKINIDKEIRDLTKKCIKEVHELYKDGTLPSAYYSNSCNSCSMKEICFPNTAGRKKSVSRYIGQKTIYGEDK